MGIFPVWGYQLIIGIALCHKIKLNKAIFVVAAHISIPPMIPLLLYASCLVGGFLLNQPFSLSFDQPYTLELVKQHLLVYGVGSVVLSLLAGAVGTGLTWAVLRKSKDS